MRTPSAAIVRLGVVDSTQRVAFDLLADGAPDGTVVVADEQRAGRGRRGREWHAAAGESLLASIVVRPRLPLALWPTLSLATGVAVVEALAAEADVAGRLKWPNDVLVGGRKLAGILLESRIGAGSPAAVIGIGINLSARSFPPALRERATSVALVTGRVPDRDALLARLLDVFHTWRARLETHGFAPVRARWLELSETIGRTVSVDGREGLAIDLDEDGALLLRDGAGALQRIVSGEVNHAARG